MAFFVFRSTQKQQNYFPYLSSIQTLIFTLDDLTLGLDWKSYLEAQSHKLHLMYAAAADSCVVAEIGNFLIFCTKLM